MWPVTWLRVVSVSRPSVRCGATSRKRDQSCSVSWKASWSTPCPIYKTPSEREIALNKPCAGPMFLPLSSKTVYSNYQAMIIREFSLLMLIIFFSFRRQSEHDQVVRSIYEEMESQIREEREKRLTQVHMSAVWFSLFTVNLNHSLYIIWSICCEIKESMRQKQRGQLEEELKIREQDLENTLIRQREVGVKVALVSFLNRGLMSNMTCLSLVFWSWSPESTSWAANRRASRSRTSSCTASTSSCRSSWRTAKRSCTPLWLSSASCSSTLPRNKWPSRGETWNVPKTRARATVKVSCWKMTLVKVKDT